jgi:hypothetical protein
MFANELELFSIGIINLLLENVNAVIVNIVQIEKTINFANFVEKPTIIHKGSAIFFVNLKNLR